MSRRLVSAALLVFIAAYATAILAEDPEAKTTTAKMPVVEITTVAPDPPPAWATLERQLFAENAAACREFYDKYFDDRGWLECVERWGGDDGPDDAIECVADWPLLFALGADASTLDGYRRAWEGHLQQYTAAKTRDVDLARDGMYWREFPVMFDWVHHGEGITAFLFAGLAAPDDPQYRQRLERFANFYTGDDPLATNYDPEHKLIRSLFNGSRGPLLRQATALDWAGDPIDAAPFKLQHGERNYQEMLAHFQDYNDVVGDHPQNLCATSLAFYAYALTGEAKYRRWALEYVDAWVQRMEQNHGILPTNIGLDGVPGSAAGGKWYGGVYGWAFSVTVPQTGETAHRNTHHLGLAGFGNATLLTGDHKYAAAWQRQIAAVNAQAKQLDGKTVYPHMYGDQGWYHFTPEPYRHGERETHYWTTGRLDASDSQERADAPHKAAQAFERDLANVHQRLTALRADTTTPQTRLADDPLGVSPAQVQALVRWTLGGIYPGHNAAAVHAAVRYFDPVARRAGLPSDVAALVEDQNAHSARLRLVNLHRDEPRELIVQGGAYGEHAVRPALDRNADAGPPTRWLRVRLAAGAAGTVELRIDRYALQPTLTQPFAAP